MCACSFDDTRLVCSLHSDLSERLNIEGLSFPRDREFYCFCLELAMRVIQSQMYFSTLTGAQTSMPYSRVEVTFVISK